MLLPSFSASCPSSSAIPPRLVSRSRSLTAARGDPSAVVIGTGSTAGGSAGAAATAGVSGFGSAGGSAATAPGSAGAGSGAVGAGSGGGEAGDGWTSSRFSRVLIHTCPVLSRLSQ